MEKDYSIMKILIINEKLKYSERKNFGLPKFKKFPMPDKKHVLLAIKFFNWAFKKHGINAEKELAENILSNLIKFNIPFESIILSKNNRFKKYFINN